MKGVHRARAGRWARVQTIAQRWDLSSLLVQSYNKGIWGAVLICRQSSGRAGLGLEIISVLTPHGRAGSSGYGVGL